MWKKRKKDCIENIIDFVITEVNNIGDKLSLLAMCNVYIDGKDVVIAKTKEKDQGRKKRLLIRLLLLYKKCDKKSGNL